MNTFLAILLIIVSFLLGAILLSNVLYGMYDGETIEIYLTGNMNEDSNTILHEATHMFVEQDPEHFCSHHYNTYNNTY